VFEKIVETWREKKKGAGGDSPNKKDFLLTRVDVGTVLSPRGKVVVSASGGLKYLQIDCFNGRKGDREGLKSFKQPTKWRGEATR